MTNLVGRRGFVSHGGMTRLLLIALALTPGCGWAASRSQVGPDTWEIRCGASSVCYAAASDECPDGYDELDREESVTGQTIQSQTYGPPEAQTTNVQVYNRVANRLVVRCR